MIKFLRSLAALPLLAIPLIIMVVVGIMDHFGWDGKVSPRVLDLGDWAIDTAEKIQGD